MLLCTAATGCAEKQVDYSVDDTESTGQTEEADRTLTSVDAPSTYEISIPTESSEIGTITIRDEKVNQTDCGDRRRGWSCRLLIFNSNKI